ncbi:3005_t:CDS:2, partial [Cetraspora pellucida]
MTLFKLKCLKKEQENNKKNDKQENNEICQNNKQERNVLNTIDEQISQDLNQQRISQPENNAN